MKKSNKILAVLGIILFIGIVIPKLTVRDNVSLTAEEKSCLRVSIQQQFDHPLQRIALWLGKSAVMYKQGDGVIKSSTLIVKSYTIFRIPLPATRFFNRFTSHIICDWASEKTNGVFLEVVEFTESMQNFVIENFGHPIGSGFTAPMYLRAFPGLMETDFDGVETAEGKYEYSDSKLAFIKTPTGRYSTFDEAILEKGHETLLSNIRGRLGSKLSVDEIIKGITAQGIGRISGTILLGQGCPQGDGAPDDMIRTP